MIAPARVVKKSGVIAWMAQNSVSANLLMLVLMIGGLVGAFSVKQEVFPEFDLDLISVSVPYPGATPEDVEQGIILSIEEAVRSLDGVKRVSSVAAEGAGNVNLELYFDADPITVLSDVKNAVDRITTFPEEAEEPTVAILAPKREVIFLVIAAEESLKTLHNLAEKARESLLAFDEISQVEVQGLPDLEIRVEIPQSRLEALNMTLAEVATRIRAASKDLPAGGIKTGSGELLVRVDDRRRSGPELANIVIKNASNGHTVLLGEIATIYDDYAQTDQTTHYYGKPAVYLTIYRIGDETPQEVANAVKNYAQTLQQQLPDHFMVGTWDDDSEKLQARIELLVRNAALGLVMVLIILALFLDYRLALWVALGIPVSFLGAFMIMPGADLSINMVTLFAFIITLGMVVDDAIVVGENIHAHMRTGQSRLDAAIAGAQEMATPVTFSILTTCAAFLPLFFIPGFMGKIFGLIPAVVLAVLIFSLLESFWVLPAHLGHGDKLDNSNRNWADRIQDKVNYGLNHFINNMYAPFLKRSLNYRYITMAIATLLFVGTVVVVVKGAVPFNFFPKVEADRVRVTLRLPFGAPVEQTQHALKQADATAKAIIKQLNAEDQVRGWVTLSGHSFSGGGHGPTSASNSGSHLGSIQVSLIPQDQGGTLRAAKLSKAWAKAMPQLPGVEAIQFQHSAGPGAGADINVQVSHRNRATLITASNWLTQEMRGIDNLINVDNDFSGGKPQISFQLRESAHQLGITSDEVARQLRASYYGAEALRDQRGRLTYKVMVRLPESERISEDNLRQLLIQTPTGGAVPLYQLVTLSRGRAPTVIRREEGLRVINVSGELLPGIKTPRPILTILEKKLFPQLKERFPEIELTLTGQQREQGETFSSLKTNYPLALFVIFALIAIPFKSYVQPIIIMSVIPLGFVGAVVGHWIMGFGLSMVSLLGIVALSGVVVNDSLVLIHATNQARHSGKGALEAIIFGGVRRFRPILLTSLTTFFGLVPMILETSIQARFLIPMALSLGFGVLFATFIVLIVVPALYLILEKDILRRV
ncbi:MAG: efflux RND transporter permease subunit [Magnetococcales bacterium]|nr:efflux RND transporter permease subunit [Magnetococcales bacterium]